VLEAKLHIRTEQQGKITVRYILIFVFLDSKPEDQRFCAKQWQAFGDMSLLLISS